MSVETLIKSRRRVFFIYPICFFLWSITQTDFVETFLKSQISSAIDSSSYPHTVSDLIMTGFHLIGMAILGFAVFAFWKFLKNQRAANKSIQNALKDEFTILEMAIAFQLSWLVMMLVLLIFTLADGFGLSGHDLAWLLFGLVVGLPFLIFSIRDKRNE